GRGSAAAHAGRAQGRRRHGGGDRAPAVPVAQRRQGAGAERRRGGELRLARRGDGARHAAGGMNPEKEARRVIRSGLAVIVAGAGAFLLWGLWAPLSGAIIAPGYVKVDLNRKVVQHQEGGIVRAVSVRDGDRVAQGQELVLLDDV